MKFYVKVNDGYIVTDDYDVVEIAKGLHIKQIKKDKAVWKAQEPWVVLTEQGKQVAVI